MTVGQAYIQTKGDRLWSSLMEVAKINAGSGEWKGRFELSLSKVSMLRK